MQDLIEQGFVNTIKLLSEDFSPTSAFQVLSPKPAWNVRGSLHVVHAAYMWFKQPTCGSSKLVGLKLRLCGSRSLHVAYCGSSSSLHVAYCGSRSLHVAYCGSRSLHVAYCGSSSLPMDHVAYLWLKCPKHVGGYGAMDDE